MFGVILLQQVLHFEQRIARQRECRLEKDKGKSARDLAGYFKIVKSRK